MILFHISFLLDCKKMIKILFQLFVWIENKKEKLYYICNVKSKNPIKRRKKLWKRLKPLK